LQRCVGLGFNNWRSTSWGHTTHHGKHVQTVQQPPVQELCSCNACEPTSKQHRRSQPRSSCWCAADLSAAAERPEALDVGEPGPTDIEAVAAGGSGAAAVPDAAGDATASAPAAGDAEMAAAAPAPADAAGSEQQQDAQPAGPGVYCAVARCDFARWVCCCTARYLRSVLAC